MTDSAPRAARVLTHPAHDSLDLPPTSTPRVFPTTSVPATSAPARRASDRRGPLGNPLARLVETTDNAPAVGRLMVMACAAVMVLAAPLLEPNRHAWVALGVITGVLGVAVAVSGRIDWSRLPQRATLAHPALVGAALCTLGLVEPGVFSPLVGTLTLCFTFVGLTQPSGTSSFMALPAMGVYLTAFGEVTAPILVRLIVAVLVWVLLGEVLALLTNRQSMLMLALRAAANSDALTGVANRAGWETRTAVAVPGDVVAIVDIDHFKQVNDVQGHAHGDAVLVDFGELLSTSLRDGDFCARYGGEEFALLLPATSREQAAHVLARLHRRWERMRPEISFSAGVAPCRAGRDATETFVAADAALYRAKTSGRNRDCFEDARASR